MWTKIKNFATSRDMLMYLIFVLFSTMLWFSRSENGQRQHSITMDINYIGLTPDIQTVDSLPRTLKITYTDENHSFFYKKPNVKGINIDITRQIEKKKQTISITAGTLQKMVKDELPPSTNILRIEPSSILTGYKILQSKTVPVVFNGAIKPSMQYQLVGDVIIEPAQVVIYGQRGVIDTVKAVYTKPTQIENVTESYSADLTLVPIEGIAFSRQTINLQAHAQAYTETTLVLPIEIIGAPANARIKTFPATATIKIQMGLESYKHFSKTDIKAFVNYNDMLTSTNGMVKSYVANETINVFDIKVTPENVEFIIELE